MMLMLGMDEAPPRRQRRLEAGFADQVEVTGTGGGLIAIGIGKEARRLAKLMGDPLARCDGLVQRLLGSKLGECIVMNRMSANRTERIGGDLAQLVPVHGVGAALGIKV